MRKASLFALALVLIAAAVFLAVAYDGNNAKATPTAWDSTCGDCHNGASGGVAPPAHTVPAHASIMGTCTNCHTANFGIDLSKCVACHTADGIVNAHPPASCTGTDCHAGPTTTTAAQTTTTAGQTTTTVAPTTTTAGQTTTTGGQTTTTVAPTTTTTKSTTTTSTSTTSTTVPSGTPSYTG